MLLINKGQKTHLPDSYHLANNACAHIYDQLTDLLSNKEYHPYFNKTALKITIQEGSEAEQLEAGNLNILDWLKNHGKSDELNTILVKHITLSILSDFVNFVYESIINAQKGKLSVAYALLRKPFTDELLLLEQLLIEPEEFINKFFHIGDIKLYGPSSKKHPPNEKEIIEKAYKKVTSIGASADLIYKIRYDKSFAAGINGISNQALHIVTNDSNYKTSNQNLNFVFSGSNDYERYWKQYYYFVPILLIYAASIADEILLQFLPEDKRKVKKVIRGIKRLLATDKVFLNHRKENINNLLSEVLISECEKCGNTSSLDKSDFDLFFETEVFLCSHCFAPSEFTLESIQGLSQIYDLLKTGMIKRN
ncbi:hypothetical protein DVR12_24985 [Chitinophaga silvatica]|uniref:Uncharacterized protein n=1 Tax=Chitinophaga silvatica TaxID=2282649 RepID=A0A3E1Y3M1_9BACT|nr:hypothetical protein [Chitinophaga silvatica]RFS19067.1 hypothetical protein DVR12_24985 [Chitinophaga silvatica]